VYKREIAPPLQWSWRMCTERHRQRQTDRHSHSQTDSVQVQGACPVHYGHDKCRHYHSQQRPALAIRRAVFLQLTATKNIVWKTKGNKCETENQQN